VWFKNRRAKWRKQKREEQERIRNYVISSAVKYVVTASVNEGRRLRAVKKVLMRNSNQQKKKEHQ
ncbi:hypothetical protein L9F63_000828, partial [Diploptera punctata]